MSREELIQEIIANSKRLEEIEAARKESEHRGAELEKQVELLKKLGESIRQTESGMAETIPKLQELLNKKGEETTKLQKEIDTMERESSSHRDS